MSDENTKTDELIKRFFQAHPEVSKEMLYAIDAAAQKAAEKTAKEMSHKHKCPIPEEFRSETGHLIGMIKDVGDGNIESGIEVMRDQHKYITEVRQFHQKVRDKIAGTVIVVLITSLISLLVYGIVAKVRG